jgi:uncharacterized membrane protein YuzA (DUF378 family)
MSLKTTIGTTVDVATLVGAASVTIGGVIVGYNMIKHKRGASLIVASVIVTLVGVAASKYSVQSLTDRKNKENFTAPKVGG